MAQITESRLIVWFRHALLDGLGFEPSGLRYELNWCSSYLPPVQVAIHARSSARAQNVQREKYGCRIQCFSITRMAGRRSV